MFQPMGMNHSATFPPATTSGSGHKITNSGSGTIIGSAGSGTLSTVRGGLKNAEGPINACGQGLLASVHQVAAQQGQSSSQSRQGEFPSIGASMMPHLMQRGTFGRNSYANEEALEMFSAEMSFSALYMHELHQRRMNNPYFDNYEELHQRAMWEVGDSPGRTPDLESPSRLPGPRSTPVLETSPEEEEIDDSQPLLELGLPRPTS